MAAIASFPSSLFCYRSCRETLSSSSSSSVCSFPFLRLKTIDPLSRSKWSEMSVVKAVAEDEILSPAAAAAEENEGAPSDQTVSVPVSPSDRLTMFFKAEGVMDESAVSKVSKALEEVEGISDLKVQIAEGVASVELTKQTIVQATGVASHLVEVIQGSGFKLQTLNLSFDDEEDVRS